MYLHVIEWREWSVPAELYPDGQVMQQHEDKEVVLEWAQLYPKQNPSEAILHSYVVEASQYEGYL